MPTGTYRYGLDPTGSNPDNLVANEVHSLSNKSVRAVAPTYGAFYTSKMVVHDHMSDRLLVRGTDYQCVELLQDATLRYGKEICVMLLILNPQVSSQVRLTYQCVGGEFQYDGSSIINLYETAIRDNRPVDWVNGVLNKPTEYTPSFHRHLLEDVYGFEAVVAGLERVRNALTLSDVPAFEAAMKWCDIQIKAISDLVSARTQLWQVHLNDGANPHHVTKDQVGLGNVQNLEVLSVVEANSDTPKRKYVTYDTLLEILNRKGL